jgi:DNA invertase Pin-like site-specific DNA recombinase
LSTENELVRRILLATLSSLAKIEREKISQRTKAGLERARAMGKVLGRPKFGDGDREKLRAALEGGKSWHAASIETRISYSTVKKHAGRSATSGGDGLRRRIGWQNLAW